jgi:hypothetical protein
LGFFLRLSFATQKTGRKNKRRRSKVPGSVLSHTQNAFVVNIPTLPVRQKNRNEAKTWGENHFFTTVAQYFLGGLERKTK